MAIIVPEWEPSVMTDEQLALRAEIMRSFAETGAPPDVAPSADLNALAERHVVVLDGDGAIVMAHPFAAHRSGARVESGGREWWGNCAWDAFGIVAALGIDDATVTAQDVTLRVREGQPEGDAVFHVEVPAAHWWDDVGYT
jgi:alkylmercury lyase-like protein